MKEETFTITKEHLVLAQNMYVGWFGAEYGAPTINPKRPYGNSDVEEDVHELLGNIPNVEELHKQMETALQIFLCTLSFQEGTYVKKEKYNSRSWELTPTK